MLSSHHPKAILPEAATVGASCRERKIKNDPPGGKINFPFSVSTNVVPGSPLRTKAFTPPTGSPVTFDAFSRITFVFDKGQIAVLDGVTRFETVGVPGGLVLNQNCARKGAVEISVTVQTLTCKFTPEHGGFYSLAQQLVLFPNVISSA